MDQDNLESRKLKDILCEEVRGVSEGADWGVFAAAGGMSAAVVSVWEAAVSGNMTYQWSGDVLI